MPKVFGIGLSRTGTSSMTRALTILGFRAAHFPMDPVTRREITDHLRSNGSSPALRLTALGRVDAITDTPVACTFDALDRAYPDSRFVLTVRDKESWLTSCERYWRDVLLPLLERRPSDIRAYINLIDRAIYGTELFDRTLFAAAYDWHVTRVLAHFRSRSRDLMVLNVSAGDEWPQLCSFLELPQPDVPFPHDNRTTT